MQIQIEIERKKKYDSTHNWDKTWKLFEEI